jgi:hypothetical protein
MADIELAASVITSSQPAAEMLAVRYLEAEITTNGDASGTLLDGSKAVVGSSDGTATVSGAAYAAPELAAAIEAVPELAASMLRFRSLVGSSIGESTAWIAGNGRTGLVSDAAGGSSVAAVLGRKTPLQSAVAFAAAPKAALETGGVLLQDMYLQVTGEPVFNDNADPTTGDPGTWTLPVTLRAGGQAGTRIPVGAALVKWGAYSETPSTDFTGGIILTSDLDNAPYVDVFTVFKNTGSVLPWDAAAVKPRVRMGNLKGVLGNASDKWGIAMGQDLSNPSLPYVEASDQGVTIKGEGSGVTNINGGNIQTGTVSADKLSVASLQAISANMGILDAGEIRLGNLGAGAGSLATFTGLRMYKDGSTYRLGGYSNGTLQAYFNSEGKLNAGAGAIELSASGILLTSGTAYDQAKSIVFRGTGGTVFSSIYGINGATGDREMYLQVDSSSLSAKRADLHLRSFSQNGVANVSLAALGNPIAPSAEVSVVSNNGANSLEMIGDQATLRTGRVLGAGSAHFTLEGANDPSSPSSGYGKLFWSYSRDWLFSKNAAGSVIPAGVGEISFGPNDFYPVANTTPGVNGRTLLLLYPDGVTGTADVQFVWPKGWGGRTIKCDLWYHIASTGSIFWEVALFMMTNGGGFPGTTSNASCQILDNPPDAIRKASGTFTGTLTEGNFITMRLIRWGASGSDTRGATADFVGIRLSVVD